MEIARTVLCYIKNNDDYLFLLRNKKKNDFNKGKWIGVGGGIELNETKEEALLREVKEETGLVLNSYSNRGELLFINDDFQEIMYLYTSDDYVGEIIECDEGELHWINKEKIFDLNLWEGDRTFLPLLINTNKFIKMKLIYHHSELVEVIDESETDL